MPILVLISVAIPVIPVSIGFSKDLKQASYSWNLLQEEIFANHTILLSAEPWCSQCNYLYPQLEVCIEDVWIEHVC